MKRIALLVLTVLTVAALTLTVSPVSVRADGSVFPTGTYTTTITDNDVAGLPPFLQAILVGEYKMIFREDGSLEVYNLDTGQSAQGRYVANPAVLIFVGNETGGLSCLGGGVYKWIATSNSLEYTAVSDQCLGRYIVLTPHHWMKQP